jgi:hypothetical protein
VTPVSPATHKLSELTILTAPVLILTQASIVLDVGPAMAGIAARSEAAQTPEAARDLRENIETSERS